MQDPNTLLTQAWQAHQSGDLAGARSLYEKLLSADPWQPQVNNLMGVLCLQTGEPVKALRHIRRALKSTPDDAQANANHGIALKDLGRMDEASEAFHRAVELEPGNPAYHASYGNALRLAGKPREAVGVLEDALRSAAGSAELRSNLALAQNDLGARENRSGNPAQAARHFARALELDPNLEQAHLNLGLTLEQGGELKGAERHYRAAIRSRPDFAEAYFHLAHLRTHRSSRQEIDAMQQLFDDRQMPRESRIKLAYGLGFALESAGDFSRAFEFMRRAHELQSLDVDFDLERESQRFEQIRDVFAAAAPGRAAADAENPEPIFICGMPRSGTTLTEQILSSHQQVEGTGEQTLLAGIANRLCRKYRAPFPLGLQNLQPDDLRDAARFYRGEIGTMTTDCRWFTDTTPMNFLHLGLAARLFPGARFVICMRDPMDNCLSLYRQMLSGANEFAHSLENLGGYYRLHRELVEHWKQVLGSRLLTVRYEDLVTDLEPQVRRLLGFCELGFDPACLRFYRSDRHVSSPSAAQVRQPAYTTSIGAWKRYAAELAPLRKALRYPPNGE